MKFAAPLSLILSFAACSEPESPDVDARFADVEDIVRVSDLISESKADRLVLDIQNAKRALWFEQGVNLGAIDITSVELAPASVKDLLDGLALTDTQGVTQEGFLVHAADHSEGSEIKICPPGCIYHKAKNGWESCICMEGS